MIHAHKILAFHAMRAAAYVAQVIGHALKVPPHYDVEFCTAVWCVQDAQEGTRQRVYNDDSLNYMAASRIHRWGRAVIAVEWAPDGAGTVLVLNAEREATGDAAEALLGRNRAAWARSDAEVEAWLREHGEET